MSATLDPLNVSTPLVPLMKIRLEAPQFAMIHAAAEKPSMAGRLIVRLSVKAPPVIVTLIAISRGRIGCWRIWRWPLRRAQ